VNEAPRPDNSERPAHRRRPRYSGKHPRRFEDKYKEREPQRYAETIAKVIASGKTPAGTHRPIMVSEILQVLEPKPGNIAADCTLGYGGHAVELLRSIQPGGRLVGLDADPVELPKTEARLRQLGYGPEQFVAYKSNFAGLPQVLATAGLAGADVVLADLGVSSMQLDDPARGFTAKFEGPLDMRMNPHKGQPASAWLHKVSSAALTEVLMAHADEPRAGVLAKALAGRAFPTTTALATAVRAALTRVEAEERELSVRRVFQALRIAVNDEFSALETFLRHLPGCLNPGGRVAILTFHSGEDRRVKKAFAAGVASGVFTAIADEVLRPTAEERRSNPRSSSAKLRWARKAGASP
jgi:16S rRNA (cytosine1402-N4)-methyltransferase